MAENPIAANPVAPPAADAQDRGESRVTPRIMMQAGSYYMKLHNLQHSDYIEIVRHATKQAYNILKNGGTAVDAAENAVRILEESPYFNAGRGSVLNKDRKVECDAMIMDGHTMKTGAVMAVGNFKHPVTLAKAIKDHSPHCAFSADGALEFALEFPVEFQENDLGYCREPEDLVTEFAKDMFTNNDADNPAQHDENHNTVAAVALDKFGHFACATSTGGLVGKPKGRIGDAPLVGCGGYANEFGAATTSGHGESLMEMTLAREVVFNMEQGQNALSATQNAVDHMRRRINGKGCAIAIDKNGNFGRAVHSSAMIWASMTDEEQRYGQEGRRPMMG